MNCQGQSAKRWKDALLASGIQHILHATPSRTLAAGTGRFGKALAFSFPVFTAAAGFRQFRPGASK
jgi:hypothetical protein